MAFYTVFNLLMTALLILVSWWWQALAAALIPGVVVGWLLYRNGHGVWASVVAAECMLWPMLVLRHLLVEPIPEFIGDWSRLLGLRGIVFIVLANVIMMPPVLFAIRLGYFGAGLRAKRAGT